MTVPGTISFRGREAAQGRISSTLVLVSSAISISCCPMNQSTLQPPLFLSGPCQPPWSSLRPLVHGVLTSKFCDEKLLFRQSRGCDGVKLVEKVSNASSFVAIGQELPKI